MGFGFEHFGPMGQLRDQDAFGLVDNAGMLPDGTEFVGPKELGSLVSDLGHFQRCFSEKLFTYALGRVTTREDRCAVKRVAERITHQASMSEVIESIVTSEIFRTQRNEEAP